MKLLFITTRLPYPIRSGSQIVIYNWCKYLRYNFGYEIYLYSFTEKDQEVDAQKLDFINQVFVAEKPKFVEKVSNILLKTFIKNKWPLQTSLYYSKKTHNDIKKKINDLNIDIVVCDMIRTVEYINGIDDKIVKILEMQDLLSIRYERMIKNSKMNVDAFGYYGKYINEKLKKIINFRFIISSIFKYEAKLLKEYEIEANDRFDIVTFVSNKETLKYNSFLKQGKGMTVPIGVDYQYYSEKNIEKKDKNLICFTGNMDIGQNKEAVSYFIDEMLPKIRYKVNNKVTFRIIGKCSLEYKNEIEKNKDVEATGAVDDIRDYVQESTVFVAPLVYGSGVKTKILETMAMGVPIVTNDIGSEGIDIVSGKHLFVCNDIDDFVNKTVLLLRNQEVNEKISGNAREYINQNGKWVNALQKLDSKIKVAIERE